MTSPLLKRRIALLGAMITLIVLAGCLTATVEITVDRDGSIDLEQEMIYGPELAEMVKDSPDYEGPEAIAAEMAANLENSGWVNVASEGEELEDGSLRFVITSSDNDPANIAEITVTIEQDQITFILKEDPLFDDDAPDDFTQMSAQHSTPTQLSDDDDDFFEPPIEDLDVRYIVNMPGSIISHNGEQIDDNSVEWTLAFLHEHEPEQLEVTSTLEAETPTPDDDDADGIPGFTFVLAVFALLGAALLAYRYTRRE